MSDQRLLAGYIDVGRAAIDDFVQLLESLPPEDWSVPTDLPGWDVKAIASHVAHLESVLAGFSQPDVAVEPSEHMTAMTSSYTEQGVAARRESTPAELIAEIREASAARFAELAANPPTDAQVVPDTGVPLEWSWNTLLRNRPLDVWMHEQDVRRAVGQPGGMDAAAAVHTITYYAEGLGYIVAKRAAAAPGTTVVLAIDGVDPIAVAVTDERKGVFLSELPGEPTVRLELDPESFVVLVGGRRAPRHGAVRVSGDEQLASRILANLNTTP
ncbi:maleylpyruvate isomerase family mycothiol-dependent enzyme [Salinibacterium hongtaonis]|uniref:maleylpyruvate isomerase family mycothiol-dependent enzyme n=1 Tax=Homoserinimonas hongtaonis TaxID=2079791 RepID=UPI000D38A046|nr:maleylpyruvate isomerase family mycothiol-dependent enzyme [Salinibacterium hongtaonis]AWB89622.1 hypothetical protein C2138_08770 [Salinibacterium hongtaonis]